jgi:hypothetical protein
MSGTPHGRDCCLDPTIKLQDVMDITADAPEWLVVTKFEVAPPVDGKIRGRGLRDDASFAHLESYYLAQRQGVRKSTLD